MGQIWFRLWSVAGVALCAFVGCAADEATTGAVQVAESAVERPASTEKNAYFGDLHVHSAWSLDAWAFGVRVTPEDAYRYARGEAIEHVSGQKIRAAGRPLDFVALTEHANYLGFSEWLEAGSDPNAAPQMLRDLFSRDREVAREANTRLFADMAMNVPVSDLLVPAESVANTWRRIVELADRNNVPGEFTAFVAYEYTPMPEGQNLHRNVVFRGSKVPVRPYSSLESMNPEDLWDWMDEVRGAGSDVLAIPHNQNGSNGLMYENETWDDAPIDAEYAKQRIRNEPVSEVMQIKGQSEAHPELSPNDEWADFEISPTILGLPNTVSRPQGSYARQALRDGLAIESRTGVNPYRFGMLGSSDGHNASSPVEEANYTGKIGFLDGTAEARLDRSRIWGGGSGADGSVGGGEHARGALRCDARARDILHLRPAFARAPLRGLGFFGGRSRAGHGRARGSPRRSDGQRAARASRRCARADILAGRDQGSGWRAARTAPDREGLARRRGNLREGLRRGVRRWLRARRRDPSLRERRRRTEPGRLHLRHGRREGGASRRVERSRFRAGSAELLLRPRTAGAHLSLEYLRRPAAGCTPAGRRTGRDSGARRFVARLVRAVAVPARVFPIRNRSANRPRHRV